MDAKATRQDKQGKIKQIKGQTEKVSLEPPFKAPAVSAVLVPSGSLFQSLGPHWLNAASPRGFSSKHWEELKGRSLPEDLRICEGLI